LAIKECQEVYETQNSRFEPENCPVNKGDLTDFDASNASLCTVMQAIRTSILEDTHSFKSAA